MTTNNLINELPVYFKLPLSEKIVFSLLQDKVINLVGLRGVGKKTYLKFLAKHFSEFSDQVTNFKFIDPVEEEFSEDSIGDEVQTLVFYNIDDLDSAIIERMLDEVNVVRNYENVYGCIVLSGRPLDEIIVDKHLRSRVLNRIYYYTPNNLSDFWQEIKIHGEVLGREFTTREAMKIFHLSGGHGRLTKELVLYLKLGEIPIELNIEFVKNFEKILEEIICSCTHEEKKQLIQIAKGNKCEVISPYLINIGLVNGEQGKLEITSELLSFFLKSMPSD